MKNNSYSFYCKYANSLFYKLKKYRSIFLDILLLIVAFISILTCLYQEILERNSKHNYCFPCKQHFYNSLNVYYYKHIKIHVSYVINSFLGNSDQRGRRYLCKYSRRHKPKLIT